MARHVLRSCWTWLEPIVWRALERGLLDPATVVSEVEAGLPGDAALVPLTRHPVPAARQAAMRAAAASGHPDAIAALEHLLGADDPALSATAASALSDCAASLRDCRSGCLAVSPSPVAAGSRMTRRGSGEWHSGWFGSY